MMGKSNQRRYPLRPPNQPAIITDIILRYDGAEIIGITILHASQR